MWEAAPASAPDETSVQAWAAEALGRLRFSGGEGLVEWLQSQRSSRRGRFRQQLDALLGYLEPRTSLMDYPTCRSQGWQIGTGRIESTCKQLVGLRLKGPGMHWTEAGALAVTALRAIDLNHHWATFWNHLVLAS